MSQHSGCPSRLGRATAITAPACARVRAGASWTWWWHGMARHGTPARTLCKQQQQQQQNMVPLQCSNSSSSTSKRETWQQPLPCADAGMQWRAAKQLAKVQQLSFLSLSLSMCVCMCVRARMSHVDALFCLGDEQLTQGGAVLHSTAGAVLHSTAGGPPSTHQASAVPHAPPRYPDEAANRTGMGGGDGQMGSR